MGGLAICLVLIVCVLLFSLWDLAWDGTANDSPFGSCLLLPFPYPAGYRGIGCVPSVAPAIFLVFFFGSPDRCWRRPDVWVFLSVRWVYNLDWLPIGCGCWHLPRQVKPRRLLGY